MTYVGRGVDAISNVEKLDNITFDGSTTYNLTKSSVAFTPSGKNNILVSINGVIQQGNFTVAGATIIFDFSPSSNDTCNFIMHYGTGVLNVPADSSVNIAQLGASGTKSSSTFLAGDNSFKTISGTTINNNANNKVITGSGTANTLEGEANLTFDGGTLTVKDDANGATTETLVLTNGTSANPSYSNLVFKTGGNTSGCWIKGVQASGGNDGRLEFHTNNSGTVGERMRILYDGNIAIGTTSASQSAKVSIESSGNVPAMCVESTNGSQTSKVFKVYCARNTTNGTYDLANFDGTSQTKMLIRDSGNVNNVNNGYGAISDERIKQNIIDAKSQWDDIKAIKVRNFKLKSDTTKTQLGVIAQELEDSGMNGLVADAPPTKEHVSYSSDFGSIDEEGVFTQGERVKEVKYSVLYMKAIKCLQEAMAKIETLETEMTSLKARVKTLEDA